MKDISKEEREKILDRLEKLLKHTDTSGDRSFNVNEVALANKKIKEITDEYGISLGEIRSVDNKEELVESVIVCLNYTVRRTWAGTLAGTLANFYDCRSVKTGNSRFYFIGFKLDSEICSDVFNRLYHSILFASKMYAKGNSHDFALGVIVSLKMRLNEIKREREKISSVCALVEAKEGVVNGKVMKLFPNLKDGKRVEFNRSDDFYKGVQYGKTVEIFKSVKNSNENSSDDSDEKNERFTKKTFKINRK